MKHAKQGEQRGVLTLHRGDHFHLYRDPAIVDDGVFLEILSALPEERDEVFIPEAAWDQLVRALLSPEAP
jgi:hypothetical protein